MAVSRPLIAGHLVVLVASCAVAVATSRASDWTPVTLVVLLILLAVMSDAVTVNIREHRLSGVLSAFVLLMAFAGPAPAAAAGVFIATIDYSRTRRTVLSLTSNTACFALFGVVGGLLARWAHHLGAHSDSAHYGLVVFAVYVVAIVINFTFTATTFRVWQGVVFSAQVRDVFLTVLPAEAAAMVLSIGFTIAYIEAGLTALTVAAISLIAFQLLVRALLQSLDRADQLEILQEQALERGDQLASLQVGVLAALVQTLSLRDKMTARHSAAVARYARAIAVAHGCPPAEQELVHTAGLLHDIGKFTFPDRILLADSGLEEADWEIVKRHPAQGARVVERVHGYGPVAEIILAHHERPDGTGYPAGLVGDDIPLLSRMISVADTYDVMTARDSYRTPVSPQEAVAELRRVSGTQLDGRLVELFVAILAAKDLRFQHTTDADFEAELDFESRVRAVMRA